MHSRSLFIVFASLAGLFAATPSFAANPGDLIRSTAQPDVYYVAANNKRYAFPNEKTFFTWYTNFSTVKTVNPEELASYPIGGAVTYRPGTRLIKITTDPKVYAVSKGGVLRWIQTEALATTIFGADWATRVDDVSDAYFTTYTVGSPASIITDFQPITEQNNSPTINADKSLISVTPVPTPSPVPAIPPTLDLTISKSPVQYTDVVTLTANATDPSGITGVNLFMDGGQFKQCLSSPCSGDIQIPSNNAKTSFTFTAIAKTLSGTTFTKTLTVLVDSSGSSLVKLTLGRQMIRQGQLAEATVDVDSSIAVNRIDILVNGDSVKGCATGVRQCRWTNTLPGVAGTTYEVSARVADTLGKTFNTAHQTLTIGTNDSPMATIGAEKSFIYAGESVGVTVTGSDDDGIARIDIFNNGAIIKTCENTTSCTVTSGPWTNKGAISFSGVVVDSKGASTTSDTASVMVQ